MDGMGRGSFIYYRKRNYYVLINCIRHCVGGEFIQDYFKIFSFLLIWDKNLGSHTSWPVAKPLWIHPWSIKPFMLLQRHAKKIRKILYKDFSQNLKAKIFSPFWVEKIQNKILFASILSIYATVTSCKKNLKSSIHWLLILLEMCHLRPI